MNQSLPPKMCVVCGRVLDWTDAPTGSGWTHPLLDQVNEDHAPVPVDPADAPEQMRGRCDFCAQEHPAFIVPARSFLSPFPGSASEGDWAACKDCADAISCDHWDKVTVRAIRGYRAKTGRAMEPELRIAVWQMYQQLRENITGPVRPGVVGG